MNRGALDAGGGLRAAVGTEDLPVDDHVGPALVTDPEAGATHLQLTTGDAGTFHALAGRLFGSAFPDVEQVELAVTAR